MSAFDLDPWEVARRHYEKQMMELMARLMRHFNATQVELSHDPLPADITVDRRDTPTGVFYRIKGHLRCDDILNRPQEGK